MRLAICGPRYSGKTSLCHELRDHYGFAVISYTDHLKHLAVKALAAIDFETDEATIIREKALYRPFLQDLGSVLGFDKGFGVTQVIDEWRRAGSPEPVIFDNIRFLPQWTALKGCNFKLVRLDCPHEIQRYRAAKLGVTAKEFDKQGQHKAEAGIARQPGEIVINTGQWPLESIAEHVAAMVSVFDVAEKLAA